MPSTYPQTSSHLLHLLLWTINSQMSLSLTQILATRSLTLIILPLLLIGRRATGLITLSPQHLWCRHLGTLEFLSVKGHSIVHWGRGLGCSPGLLDVRIDVVLYLFLSVDIDFLDAFLGLVYLRFWHGFRHASLIWLNLLWRHLIARPRVDRSLVELRLLSIHLLLLPRLFRLKFLYQMTHSV